MRTDSPVHFAVFSGVIIIIASLAALAVSNADPRLPDAQPETEVVQATAALVTLTPTEITPTRTAQPEATPTPIHTLAVTELTTRTPRPSATPHITRTAAPRTGRTPAPPPAIQPTPSGNIAMREIRAPILMYHYVEPLPPDANELRRGLTVTPDVFRQQLIYLRDVGYTPIDLYQLLDALATGAPLPDKPIVLTFDDGYRGIYEYAFPIMQELGYTGTVFVITQFIDEGREQYLTWEQVRALSAAGWRIEPHSKTHEDMTVRDRDFAIYQVLGSLQTVEYHVGYQPRFFAYVGGAYNDMLVQVVEELGFWGAVTTEAGQIHLYDERFLLARVRVNGRETLTDLALRLGEATPTPAPTLTPTLEPTQTPGPELR